MIGGEVNHMTLADHVSKFSFLLIDTNEVYLLWCPEASKALHTSVKHISVLYKYKYIYIFFKYICSELLYDLAP